MPAIVTSEEVETALRRILGNEDYSLSRPRQHGQTGTDIIATKDDEAIHIEVIAWKSSPPARAKDFYEAFFRAVSRLDDRATRCVIAQPSQASVGLPARAKQHRTAWQRIARAFPELEIWLVDPTQQTVERTRWGDWVGLS
jgi:hypothetical protein